MMRRIGRYALVALLILLALLSWYSAGFFRRYEVVVGSERHFGVWAIVSYALAAIFGVGAFYSARKR
jgi:polyferredoxin